MHRQTLSRAANDGFLHSSALLDEPDAYVGENELLRSLLSARVLIVAQRLETRGLLWPSKLAVVCRLPLPVLFVGPPRGAIARELRERGNAKTFRPATRHLSRIGSRRFIATENLRRSAARRKSKPQSGTAVKL